MQTQKHTTGPAMRRSPSHMMRYLVLGSVLALGAACSSENSSQGGGGQPGASAGGAANTAGAPAPAKGSGGTTVNYGRPGEPVNLVVGYQPYYTESWSGAVIRGKELWKKHLPPGSNVSFETGLQGAIIVNAMLAGKQHIGYMGDMPAIVATTKRNTGDIRMVAMLGTSKDQCNVFFVRKDAPQFKSQEEAIKWLNGKSVAVPKGSCTDRFAQATFKKLGVKPESYLNQSIEVISSNFRVGKLDAAVIWEPTASKLEAEGLARRVASGEAVNEPDGAILDMRADLIQQRPDVVKGWLKAELEAQQFLADPKNADEVVRLVKAQTTGFEEAHLRKALYGPYSPAVGGSETRITMPFVFDEASRSLIKNSTAFLSANKSINVSALPEDAIVSSFAEEVLKEANLNSPVGKVSALNSPTPVAALK